MDDIRTIKEIQAEIDGIYAHTNTYHWVDNWNITAYLEPIMGNNID